MGHLGNPYLGNVGDHGTGQYPRDEDSSGSAAAESGSRAHEEAGSGIYACKAISRGGCPRCIATHRQQSCSNGMLSSMLE